MDDIKKYFDYIYIYIYIYIERERERDEIRAREGGSFIIDSYLP
jgi:hypothetical protein